MRTLSSISTSWNLAELTPAPSHVLNANTSQPLRKKDISPLLPDQKADTKSSVPLANWSGVLSATLLGMKVLTARSTKKETSYCVTGPVRLSTGREMPRSVQSARSISREQKGVTIWLVHSVTLIFAIDVERDTASSGFSETTHQTSVYLDANIATSQRDLI